MASSCYRYFSRVHCKEIWIYVFPEKELCGLSPNFHIHVCTALPRVGFFIEPPPDTQQKRRRGERGTGVTKGSYLLLNNLPLPLPLPPHTHRVPARLPGAGLSEHILPPP
jgi:hypothetical protein